MAMDMLEVLQGPFPPSDYVNATKALQEKHADDPEKYSSEMENMTAGYIQRRLRMVTGGRAADVDPVDPVDPALEALVKQYNSPSV